MTQNELKQAVARAALAHLVEGSIVGVGTGSTADCFIDELARIRHRFRGAVASSEATRTRLEGYGIEVFDLNAVDTLPVYVDGADEINPALEMIKGGGGALTREKVIAAVAARFVCIADESKLVPLLGHFPLPVEVIPMAVGHVVRELTAIGGSPRLREGLVTDNGNRIIDVSGLDIADPRGLETRINQIVGVVTNGLFANRPADVCLLGTPAGVRTLAAEQTAGGQPEQANGNASVAAGPTGRHCRGGT